MSTYLFSSPRLGFRTWQKFDLEHFSPINADPEVMRFFAKTFTQEDTLAFMNRMNKMNEEKGYCYFAVDLLETKELIGAIGLGWKTFESDFTPCVDIGWRIGKKWWNKGLATEGAQACLGFARQKGISQVVAMASVGNLASIQIMKKVGMEFWKEFDFPDLADRPDIQSCALYHISLSK